MPWGAVASLLNCANDHNLWPTGARGGPAKVFKLL